jgi:hypothetical protein
MVAHNRVTTARLAPGDRIRVDPGPVLGNRLFAPTRSLYASVPATVVSHDVADFELDGRRQKLHSVAVLTDDGRKLKALMLLGGVTQMREKTPAPVPS